MKIIENIKNIVGGKFCYHTFNEKLTPGDYFFTPDGKHLIDYLSKNNITVDGVKYKIQSGDSFLSTYAYTHPDDPTYSWGYFDLSCSSSLFSAPDLYIKGVAEYWVD